MSKEIENIRHSGKQILIESIMRDERIQNLRANHPELDDSMVFEATEKVMKAVAELEDIPSELRNILIIDLPGMIYTQNTDTTTHKPYELPLQSSPEEMAPKTIINIVSLILPNQYMEAFRGDLMEKVFEMEKKGYSKWQVWLVILVNIAYTIWAAIVFKLNDVFEAGNRGKRQIER